VRERRRRVILARVVCRSFIAAFRGTAMNGQRCRDRELASRTTRRCGQLLAGATAAAAVLAIPGSAAAATTTTTTVPASFPSDLWVPAAVGLGAAILVVIASGVVSRCWKGTPASETDRWLSNIFTTAIKNTNAWDIKDSWLTNITAVTTVVTAIFTQTAVTDFLGGGVDKDAFTVMSILFGFAAVMGPLVFGACASRPLNESTADTPTGTRGGLLAASAVTLFASFGLLADLGLLGSYTSATGAEKDVMCGILLVAAVTIAIYAVRATDYIVNNTEAGATLISPKGHRSGTL
jgi:hypothetical protein